MNFGRKEERISKDKCRKEKFIKQSALWKDMKKKI
jgi:hypothetical protein